MKSREKIIIGTRGSELALWQAEFVRRRLIDKNLGGKIEIKVIKTAGDIIIDKPLHKIGDKGLFTKAIEEELLAGKIDIAVHSLKDLPTELFEGLEIGAVTKRDVPNDVLIAKDKSAKVEKLGDRSVIATGSLRRKAQLLNLNKTFQIVDLRGNVNTRFKKFFQLGYDAMVLAGAGVERLNLQEYIAEYIDTDVIIPAVGQGSIALEICAEDENIKAIVQEVNDEQTFCETMAERAFLREMGGGCKTPMACFGKINDDKFILKAMVASIDGENLKKECISVEVSTLKTRNDFEMVGKMLAHKFV